MNPVILAIESSCDETSAAVIGNGKVLNNIIATQKVHANYGGVVPELASREHMKSIVPVVHESMKAAGITAKDLDAVAFTKGPGLLGALLVGNSFAKGLSMSLQVPLIEVNHMQAHILSHFIEKPYPSFPFLCLTVSGGHSQLVVVRDYLDMEVIGETVDDAVGEAFDKSAKLLGLPYPGGPLIDQLASEGDPYAFDFPKSTMPAYNFSFSGIKTAILYFLRERLMEDSDFIEKRKKDLAASIQRVLISMLMDKLEKAADALSIKQVAIAGGVSANSGLRNSLKETAVNKGWEVFIPEFEYCTDNAGMIAMAAHFKYMAKDFADLSSIPDPRFKF